MESTNNLRYLVTELMATDLNTILKAKRVEDQFAQYFMYQIMVGVIYTKNTANTIFWPTIAAWSKISPLSRRHPSRSKTKQHSGQRELRPENMRLWPGPRPRIPHDRLCLDEVLPCAGDHAHMAKIQRESRYMECRVYLRWITSGRAVVPRKEPYQPILRYHRSTW